MATKARPDRARPLVVGYLERASSKVLSEHSDKITTMIGRSHGIYALYKGERLYYVGLATNLKGRIRQHLRDKHAGKWTRFSLYLVRRAAHIKELESLILRVADPKGNKTGGTLKAAVDFKPDLEAGIMESYKLKVKRYFEAGGRAPARTTQRKVGKRHTTTGRQPTLAPYVTKRFSIRADYKGKTHRASVRMNGTISYGGKIFTSPSLAGREITKKTCSGWSFWRFKKDGAWVKLDELRRRRRGRGAK